MIFLYHDNFHKEIAKLTYAFMERISLLFMKGDKNDENRNFVA